jgi:type VI secretion system protein ImpF
MPKRESEEIVTQSLLDRLIDREPSLAADPSITRAQSVRQLKAGLKRDLEWLLNTRRTPEEVDQTYQELEQSLFNFGLPDVTAMTINSSKDRARLLRLLENTVAAFEPRLDRVKVTQVDTGSGAGRVLRFQIEGYLLMDPAPEHISFDTVLQLASGEYQVQGEQSAG